MSEEKGLVESCMLYGLLVGAWFVVLALFAAALTLYVADSIVSSPQPRPAIKCAIEWRGVRLLNQ